MFDIDLKKDDVKNLSPMLRQYLDVLNNYKDSILFFRIGDFYETFFEQAKIVSRLLNLVLTGKDCGTTEKAPMCGVPYHAANVYISKLLKLGYKVAIAEQMENPKDVKGIVKREVTKVYTPGTVLSSEFLEEKINNFLMSIYYYDGYFGISMFDFSTGEFYISNISSVDIVKDIINKYKPKEILINNLVNNSALNLTTLNDNNFSITSIDDVIFDLNLLKNKDNELLFKILKNLNNYEDIKTTNAIYSSISIYVYVKNNQKNELSHLEKISYLSDDSIMYLDYFTIRNLELTESINTKNGKSTLLYILDKTKTAMGGRLLRKYIEEPLKKIDNIMYRQDAVTEFLENPVDLTELREYLSSIYDLERIYARINMKNATAKDLISFKNSIYVLPYIKSILSNFKSQYFVNEIQRFDTLKDLYELVDNSIVDEPPYFMHEGGIIKIGYNLEIDKLRESKLNGKNWLLELEENERNKTGIKNLKIKYSRLTGYLFEISNAYKGEIPDYFQRKQTLTNAERFATKELTELQNLILTSEDRLSVLEYEVFESVREKLKNETARVKNSAKVIANIDVLSDFSFISSKNNYCCPKFNEDGIIDIKDGRHPVVETFTSVGSFISNNTFLDNKNFIDIITGPNMAGKSTYMRQVALIVLLSQIGMYVPAKECYICPVDRIFTRVGASDDLSSGKSTFMVEMSEVSNIINNATKNSLIILDEIGRGTSTYDGLSIAWSVIEYISKNIKAKTLFSTHYHELTELENKVFGVNNFNIKVAEKDDDIIFLRKIERGHAEKSYGIAVAKLAGLPDEITENAKMHLKSLIS